MEVTLRHECDDINRLDGHWVWAVSDPRVDDQQNCLFRRRFRTSEVGRDAVLRISADSRYRVWLNGKFVGRGPCRGMLDHYNFETYDLSDLLAEGDGENILAIDVRWYGSHSPVAEVHCRAGLWVMLGGRDNPAAIVTEEGTDWKCMVCDAFEADPIPAPSTMEGTYCVVDSCEDVDLRKIPSDWDTLDCDDSGWSRCRVFMPATGQMQSMRMTHYFHELQAREIPMLEEKPIMPDSVMQTGDIVLSRPPETARYIQGELRPHSTVPAEQFWGDKPQALVFEEPGTHYVIVNMGQHTTAYPIISVNTHVGAMVEMRYTEALSTNRVKGVRDDPAAGTVEGYFDVFTCREGCNSFEPYVWRSFRFVRLAIHHPDGPASIECFNPVFTGYPFRQLAKFESSDPLLKKIWDISWQTARLCAHEHYEDCPYYEQLQYVGDTRLQALISYIVTGDFRLARQALRQFAETRRPDGITKSRSPSSDIQMQVIPQFSLFWILFLEDFYIHSGDTSIISQVWDCVESVLAWFEKYINDDGIITWTPYWNFTDWSLPRENEWCGSIGELNIRRAGALQSAARMADVMGMPDRAEHFRRREEAASEAILKSLRSSDGIFIDALDGTIYGEHATLAAIAYDLVDTSEALRLVELMESKPDIARTTIYHSYYAFRVYEKLGMFEKAWTTRLGVWTDQLDLHATTWFEGPGARSDCHAWGSWLMCDMLNCILGVRPAEPGFNKVIVKPHLLLLEYVQASIVTIHGEISGNWRREGDTASFEYTLPDGVSGTLILPDGSSSELRSGLNMAQCKVV